MIGMGSATLASGSMSAGSGLLGIVANAAESAANRRFQAKQAQINRDWQSNENKLSRDWQEKMWNAENLYNTPSAMMQRYRDANLNPFVLGTNSPVVGQAGSAGNAPSGGSFTPASSGSQAHFSMPDLGDMFLKASQISANVANQRAEKVRTLVDGATQAYKIGGKGAFRTFVHTFAPFLISSDENNSPFERMLTSQIRENVANAVVQENQGSLIRAFGERQALQGLEESNYRISEIVARLNTLRITNDIAIKKLANETLVAVAQAFNLRKQGEYYDVSSDQMRAIKQYVVDMTKAQSELASNEADFSSFVMPFRKGLVAPRTGAELNHLDVEGNRNLIFMKYVMDMINGRYHVSESNVNVNSPQNVPYNSKSAQWHTTDNGHDVLWNETRYFK